MESWVFLGNPGAGKSTLLNCLAQRVVFASGVSFGGGLTKDAQTFVDATRRVVYTDTPGLADPKAERAAADAITRALRTSGDRVKLCFVVRLQLGHVVGQDLVTMERVLDSIRMPNVPFGIIVNGMAKSLCERLVDDPLEAKRLVTLVNCAKYKTPHVVVVPETPQLLDVNNKMVKLPLALRAGIERIPTARIPHGALVTIDVTGLALSVASQECVVAKLERDKRALAKAQSELEYAKPDVWDIAIDTVVVATKIVLLVLLLA